MQQKLVKVDSKKGLNLKFLWQGPDVSGQGGLRWSWPEWFMARVAGVTVVGGAGLAVMWVKLNGGLWVPNLEWWGRSELSGWSNRQNSFCGNTAKFHYILSLPIWGGKLKSGHQTKTKWSPIVF